MNPIITILFLNVAIQDGFQNGGHYSTTSYLDNSCVIKIQIRCLKIGFQSQSNVFVFIGRNYFYLTNSAFS